MTVNPIATVEPLATAMAPAQPAPAAAASQTADQATSVDLFDYVNRSAGPDPMLLQPDAQARFLGNPVTLGERMLGHLEAFHKRANAAQELTLATANGQPATAAAPLPNPAMQLPQAHGPAAPAGGDSVKDIMAMVVRSAHWVVETNLVARSGSQVTNTTSTLLRGQ